MIEVKRSVAEALHFLQEMLEGEGLTDVRLEEVELSDDGSLWHITLSFLRRPPQSDLVSALGLPQREYKMITMSSDTGEMRSMKITAPA